VPLLIYQGKLNMLDREPMDEGILDFCHQHGVGFIAFSPLAQGLLTDRYLNGVPADSRMAKGQFLKQERLTPEMMDFLLQLKADAEAAGHTMAQHALRWILDQQGVTSVLVGASSVEQLSKNLAVISTH
jgi:L-glyceraldehyde 3-phosphate reductase